MAEALGRLASSSSNMAETARSTSYQYDLAGNRTQVSGKLGLDAELRQRRRG